MTKETEVTVPDPITLTRDEPDTDLEAGAEAVEIVEDVVVVDPDEPISAADSDDPRGDIYKRHGLKREQEISNQQQESEPGVENDGDAAIIASGDNETSTPPDEDPLVEVVIFEQVRQVPQSKIDKAGGIQMYQMREAAQEQMRRNAARAKELDGREQALDERERSAPQPPAVPSDQHSGHQNPNDLPSDDQSFEVMALRYQDAVLDGDDNAPSILAEMVQKAANSGTHFDEDAFRQQVKDDVLADQRRSKVVKARTALIEDTPELDKNNPKFDHRLYQAVDDETDVLEKRNPHWEPDQVITQAWENVRKWRGSHQTSTMTDKQRGKQSLNRPSSATQRFTPPAPPPRQTNSDYVRDERKRRGLEV